MFESLDLTAVIAVKDRLDNLRYCIHSILSNAAIPHVIVVDFGSSERVVDHLPKHPQLNVIRVEKNTAMFHKARALNIGIKAAETTYLCMTDADQIFAANFFPMVYGAVSHADTIVFGKTYFLNTFNYKVPPESIRALYGSILNAVLKNKPKPRGYGCCHGVSREWALRVHGYDEEYLGWGGEDRDFEFRAKYAGLGPVWLHGTTNMMHLPHPKNGIYYDNAFIEHNVLRLETLKNLTDNEEKIDRIVANKTKNWGSL